MTRDVRFEMLLSDGEVAVLDRERGLASRAAYVRSRLFGPDPETVQVHHTSIGVGSNEPTEAGHRHRRHVVIGKSAVKGAMVDQWACACGKVLT